MNHKHWYKVWQDRLLSDPDYRKLPLAERGLLADLRSFAARRADKGVTGETPATLARLYGLKLNRVKSLVERLSNVRLISSQEDTGLLVIPHWEESQETPAASRKRRQRERERVRDSHAGVTAHVTGEEDAEEDEDSPNRTKMPPQPEQVTATKKAGPNAWAWWIEANRRAGRPDPTPNGSDTKAGKNLGVLVASGHLMEDELKDCLTLYLEDTDGFLERNGHALRMLAGRLDAYRNKLTQAEGQPLDAATIDAIYGKETNT